MNQIQSHKNGKYIEPKIQSTFKDHNRPIFFSLVQSNDDIYMHFLMLEIELKSMLLRNFCVILIYLTL